MAIAKTTTALTLPAPAKINLFLHIIGRREDGYHLLQTAFQLLDYSDELTFTPNDSGAITISGTVDDIPLKQNLIYKAATHLQHTQAQGSQLGAHIHLNKKIPMGGGLGGGSSNAATTLIGLNHLWGTQQSIDQLSSIGLKLGADVPLFVRGHSAWAEGVGEQLTPLALPQRWFLVVTPGCHVSTADIFQNNELTRNSSPIKISAFLDGAGQNDCEPLVRKHYHKVDNALIWLSQYGSAKLTGTGACIFASFATQDDADRVLKALPPEFSGFVAKGINQSPLQGLTPQGLTPQGLT